MVTILWITRVITLVQVSKLGDLRMRKTLGLGSLGRRASRLNILHPGFIEIILKGRIYSIENRITL